MKNNVNHKKSDNSNENNWKFSESSLERSSTKAKYNKGIHWMYEDKKNKKNICSNARNRKSITLDIEKGDNDLKRTYSNMEFYSNNIENQTLCENWIENDGSIFEDEFTDKSEDAFSNPCYLD